MLTPEPGRFPREFSEATASVAMTRYADGDDEAFETLHATLAPRLLAYTRQRMRNSSSAEDIVQETLLRVHHARDRFHRGANVFPWAFSIARRLIIDATRRRAARYETFTSTDDFPACESPHDRYEGSELADIVTSALATLPENQRQAFDLVRLQGRSLADASRVLGVTENAVKLRVNRAHGALRERVACVKSTSRVRG